MTKTDNTTELLSAISSGFTDEELLSSCMQGLIAAQISMKRQDMGMNQTEFAAHMGVSQGLVSRWEKGEANFTIDTLCRISAKLGIPMQCPFVTGAPPVYSENPGRITTFPSRYVTTSYSSPGQYDKIDLEEM